MSEQAKPTGDTDFFSKRSEKNALLLKIGFSIVSALIIGETSLIKWIGSNVVAKVEEQGKAVAGMQVSMAEVKGDLGVLHEGMKNVALKTDMTILQMEIDTIRREEGQEIDGLKKETDRLSRRVLGSVKNSP